jgi:hypothetical protein
MPNPYNKDESNSSLKAESEDSVKREKLELEVGGDCAKENGKEAK